MTYLAKYTYILWLSCEVLGAAQYWAAGARPNHEFRISEVTSGRILVLCIHTYALALTDRATNAEYTMLTKSFLSAAHGCLEATR